MDIRDFTLRGKPVIERWPAIEAALQSAIDRADPYLNVLYQRIIEYFEAIDDWTFDRLIDQDEVRRHLDPGGMTYIAFEDFLRDISYYVPAPVPVPTRWEAKAVLARNYHGTDHGDDEILLQVRFPNHAISQEPYDFLNPQVVAVFHPEFIDRYQRPWTVLARDPGEDTGCEVGIRPAGSTEDFVPLNGDTSHHRHMFQTGIDTWSFPDGAMPVEVAVRIRNYAVDQTDLKRDGEWSDPKVVTHAYSDKFRAWTGKLRHEMDDSDMVLIGRTMRYPCTPVTMQPDIPLAEDAPAALVWTASAPAAPVVSAGTREWLVKQSRRYGESKRTGKHWREVADALS